ncbi:hypothetical protein H4Q26_011944 [Puccinia striiformis f. sp. tritici PST-130]|nr:hypothetical protein H4Q26_011944 [Puccinia striiformis f. sp. tritici PST-130]
MTLENPSKTKEKYRNINAHCDDCLTGSQRCKMTMMYGSSAERAEGRGAMRIECAVCPKGFRKTECNSL